MSASSPRIRSLLRQAGRVAEAGKRAAAESLYRQIVEEAPDTAQAWVGLGELVADPDEREAAYRKALELDPDNDAARAGLASLRGDAPPDRSSEASSKTKASDSDPFDQAREWLDKSTARSWFTTRDEIAQEPRDKPISKAAEPEPAVQDESLGAGADASDVLYCAVHPNRQTSLRCNRCGRPICSSCAQVTPVGYRCRDCIREHHDVFYTATLIDYVAATGVSLALGLLAGVVAARLGFFVFFLGAIAGSLIGRAAFRVAGRRRGRWLPQVVAAAVAVGGILPVWPFLLALLLGQLSSVLGLVWTAVYVVIATGAAYYQMKP